VSGLNDEQVSFSIFDVDQVFRAPKAPGIYAWFLRFQLPDRYAESDEGMTKMSSDLSELREYLRPPKISLESPSIHGAKWGGELGLSENNERTNLATDIDKPLRAHHLTQVNNILGTLMPVLYIGKADNLHQRLEQHVRAIRRFEDGERFEIEFEGKEFSERVYSLKIDPFLLRFTYFQYPDIPDGSPHDGVFKSNAIAEKSINQALRPILGKK
jgi:hypothetical protein